MHYNPTLSFLQVTSTTPSLKTPKSSWRTVRSSPLPHRACLSKIFQVSWVTPFVRFRLPVYPTWRVTSSTSTSRSHRPQQEYLNPWRRIPPDLPTLTDPYWMRLLACWATRSNPWHQLLPREKVLVAPHYPCKLKFLVRLLVVVAVDFPEPLHSPTNPPVMRPLPLWKASQTTTHQIPRLPYCHLKRKVNLVLGLSLQGKKERMSSLLQ